MRWLIGLYLALFCFKVSAQGTALPKLCSFDFDVTSSEIGFPESVTALNSDEREWRYPDGITFVFKSRYLVAINSKSGERIGETAGCSADDIAAAARTFVRQTRTPTPSKTAAKVARQPKTKKEGVRIGMTQKEVLESSWGRPADVNRTTTAYSTNEQWVYGGGNYLYFRNGILTAIQN